MECIRRLCDAIDTTFDDRISLDEIKDYVRLKQLPIKEREVEALFEEAISGRGCTSEKQRRGPITHEEVAACVRGRHRWNSQGREWEIKYRPFRNYWIVLLLTVNERIFALPMPKIVPSRIKA